MTRKTKKQTRTFPRTSVAIDPAIRDQARALCAATRRTFTKQIEFLIEQEYARTFGKRKAAA